MKFSEFCGGGNYLKPDDLVFGPRTVKVAGFEKTDGKYGDQLVMRLHSGEAIGLNKTQARLLAEMFNDDPHLAIDREIVISRAEVDCGSFGLRIMIVFSFPESKPATVQAQQGEILTSAQDARYRNPDAPGGSPGVAPGAEFAFGHNVPGAQPAS